MRAVAVAVLATVIATGCDSSLGPEIDDVIDVCAAALSDESFFPIELGRTWSYVYDDGSSGPFNSAVPITRHEGTLLWTVIELSCQGTTARFRIKEAFQGVHHGYRWQDSGEWIERDTSWSNLIRGTLRDSSLTLSKYTSDSLDVRWIISDASVDTIRLSWSSGPLFGGEDYAQIDLVRGFGISYASVGIWGRPRWWQTINQERVEIRDLKFAALRGFTTMRGFIRR